MHDDSDNLLSAALAAIAIERVHVTFRHEPHDAAQRLLAFLGATWDVDPAARILAAPVSERDPESGRIERLGELRKGVST